MFKVGDRVLIKNKTYTDGEYNVVGYIISETECYVLGYGNRFKSNDLVPYTNPLETLVADTYRKLKEKENMPVVQVGNSVINAPHLKGERAYLTRSLTPEEQDFINRAELLIPKLKEL